ncbi:MAG: 5-formyltetrahydrofolate cyclo-ligase [Candidatus Hydrogenedentes bacterium]|nr:5-formyltetrahydrofolate cyclo-ligase [Candidatus Hydrogenedentota bacterium]
MQNGIRRKAPETYFTGNGGQRHTADALQSQYMETKPEIRARMLALRRALPEAEACERSARVREQVYRLAEFQRATRVFTYVSSKVREVDTLTIIADLLSSGREVACPHVALDGVMTWRRIPSMSALTPGKFGVLEPGSACEPIEADASSVVLVPGIAFTISGDRLGYGKGYFDRFLARYPGVSIGLAYDLQVVPQIPREPHDVRLHMLVTESQSVIPSV